MKKLFLFGAAFIVSLTLSFTATHAQACAGVAPTNISWSPQICGWFNITMPNSSVCSTYVCYSTRTVNGVVQICIEGAGSNPNCYDISQHHNEASAFWTAIGQAIIKTLSVPSPCPPCTDPVVLADVFNSACVKIVNDDVHQVSYLVRCDDAGYCKRVYTVCCPEIGGPPEYSWSSFEQIGNSCTDIDPDPDCFPSCTPY